MLFDLESMDTVRIVRMKHGAENRFSWPFVKDLNLALDQIESDRTARSAVFIGAHEKYFSNGLDLNWLITQEKDVWISFLLDWEAFLHRVFTFPKPLVAAINGHAFAGGLFLALATDYRVMREDRGWLCIPEIDLGLDLPPGNVALIQHVIGSRHCEFYSLTGRRVPSDEAIRIGMVDELAPADQVLPRAVAMARQMGTKAPAQFAAHKRNLRAAPARALLEDDPPYVRDLVERKQGNKQ